MPTGCAASHNRAMPRRDFDKPPLLVFADDWGRHPSSAQHLILRLLRDRQVVWVNTIGTRPLRFDLGTARRVAEKLGRWSGNEATAASPSAASAPRVLDPKMWPSFRSSFGRRVNRALLLRSLRPIVTALSQAPVAVTTLPLAADLVGALPAKRWIYYCVDDFAVWPGYDGASMGRMERELVSKVDDAIAVSEHLVEHLSGLGRSAHLLTHGVDLDAWTAPTSDDFPAEFDGLAPPFVVFWGVIDRRMNVETMKCLSESWRGGTMVLFGPCEDPDPALLALPHVRVRPPVSFARLGTIAGAAAVLVMPYADTAATRAMQPLKLKEYLATGKPVVVSDLPATRPWADACDVCVSPQEFARRVMQRIVDGTTDSQRTARLRLVAESWDAKARQFGAWIDGGR